jgi:hypothetical protein
MSAARVLAASATTGQSSSVVEPAGGESFAYDSRATVARAVLGPARADVLWRLLKGRISSKAIFVLWLLGCIMGGAVIFAPGFSNWSTAAVAFAISIPCHVQYYAFLNVPLLRKSLFTFDAIFLTAQIAIMCVGGAGSLVWNESALWFFGAAFPAYFTIVTSDACHRSIRPRVIFCYVFGLLFLAFFIAIIITNSDNSEKIELNVLNLWNFKYPVNRMAFAAIMTLAMLLSKTVFRFVRHPDQLAILRAPLVISRTGGRDALTDRTLTSLKAAVALGGNMELQRLARRLTEVGAALAQELSHCRAAAADGEEEAADEEGGAVRDGDYDVLQQVVDVV